MIPQGRQRPSQGLRWAFLDDLVNSMSASRSAKGLSPAARHGQQHMPGIEQPNDSQSSSLHGPHSIITT